MQTEKDQVRESCYDGIQEYDNDLPRWWLVLFYITIAYGVIYAVYAEGVREPTEQRLAAQVAEIHALRPATQASGEMTEEQLQAAVQVAATIEKGKVSFTTRCAPCHGANGQGIVGPNLTDDHWIHGGKLTQIKNVIEVGVIAKGMVPWKGQMPEEEIVATIAYIRSLRGTNPANAKAPEGNLVVE
jgi:cytochrome c oxidase cbb3-type subunit 3